MSNTQSSLSTSRNYLLLFIIWPFLSFLMALFNYKKKEARIVVYIFLIYYGLNFVLSGTGIDAERYADNLIKTARLPFSDFFRVMNGLYSDTTVDIVEPFVTFIVSRFTDNSGVLFAVWSAIFAFFYLKSINILVVRYQEKTDWKVLVILSFFIMIIPITTVSGVRMPIAMWMFFYGAYHVILNRDIKYLILSLSASLVHWSFMTANALLIIYFFVGNRNFIYIPLAIISFILPQLLSPLFKTLAFSFGGPIQARYEGYSNEDYILGIQDSYEKASWFMTLSDDLLFYFFIFAIIIIQLRRTHFEVGVEEKNLFSFLILFLSFVNFGKVIPTFGGRFQSLFYLFAALYLFLNFLKMPQPLVRFLTWTGMFPMALYAAIIFRIGADTINLMIFTPGLGIPLLAPVVSVGEILFH